MADGAVVAGPITDARADALWEERLPEVATTRAAGGHGAVREVIEALLKARGVWPEMLERYFTEPAIRGA